VSVAILSVGSVLVMQALARVAHAQVLAESMASAQLFAASKMAAIELACREGCELDEAEEGRVRVGEQTLEWRASAEEVPEDPALRSVSLAVTWRRGAHTFERRLDTWLRTSPEAP